MDLKHELVLPCAGLPFRMFLFEGRSGNYRVTKHWHDSVEIFTVLEGEIDFYINSSCFGLSRGSFIIVNSNEVHSIDAPKENFTIVLQIPVKEFEKYKENNYIQFKHTPKENRGQELVRLICQMYTDYEEKRYGYECGVLSCYYRMLFLLLTGYRETEVDAECVLQSRKMSRLFDITAYIQEHFREDLTLVNVASIFGFSPSYLSRIFKRYGNVNYKSYVLNVRVEYAFRELLNTDKSINKIAENNGFPDGRSFSKAFSGRFGITPDRYRKEISKRTVTVQTPLTLTKDK